MTDWQSHTKINFFHSEKTGKCLTILQVADCLTCDCLCTLPSQTLCIITTVCTRREDSVQLPLGDAKARQSIVFPGGMTAIDWLPTEEERKQPIPGRTVYLDSEVA